MKKKLAGLFALLALALVVAAFVSPAQEVKADVTGTGTKNDPYIVTTMTELCTYLNKNPGYVKLGNDISYQLPGGGYILSLLQYNALYWRY